MNLHDTYLLGRSWERGADGRWINANHRRLCELINQYDPTMHLVWVPPENRQEGDSHPFGILHELPGKPAQIIFTLTEVDMEIPHKVLARVAENDLRTHDVFKRLDLEAQAERVWLAAKREEELAEKNDFRKSILKSPLHTFQHKGHKWVS
jgi:hypothetical protein